MTEAIKFEGMTFEQYEAYIASRNVAWHKASKQRKRVWLAKDVLAQLNAKYFRPTFGVYLGQSHYAKCEGCALGGMLAACTLRESTVGCLEERARHTMRSGAIRSLLEAIFEPEQLAEIEAAFEGNTVVVDNAYGALPTVKLAEKWTGVTRFDNPEASDRRMRLIMANIINNHGVFDPSKPPSDKDYKVAGLTRGTPKDANV